MGDLKVRRTSNKGQARIVWFGSCGKSVDGSTIWYNDDDKHDNFAVGKDYVADSLTQKLHILQRELWWNVSFGLPLVEKLTSKTALDATVIQIIMSQPDVKTISFFESSISNHKYSANVTIESKYGQISLSI